MELGESLPKIETQHPQPVSPYAAQKLAAEQSLAAHAAKLGMDPERVATHILPVRTFTYAEGYHQKYALTRYSELRTFLEETYPDPKSLADSTVATRLNAVLGYADDLSQEEFLAELPSYGLPEDLQASVAKLAARKLP